MHMFDNWGNVAKCLALNVFEKCLNFVWRFLYKTCTHFYWQWPRLVFSSGYSPRGSFFSLLHNNTEILVLGQNLYTRIWLCAMISLFKKPVSICQTGWRESWNSFPVIKLNPLRAQNKISALFNPFTAKFSQKQISTKFCEIFSTMCKYGQRAFIWMVTS